VHILDPFTGTGTFITRLLQSGLIKDKDLRRKYLHEIHCNEIVLLAYYIADVNIESVFHALKPQDEYLPYDGICLTDTFQTTEDKNAPRDLFPEWFAENSKSVEEQKKAPVRVIIGNPPYSVGQKSANDNAQNTSYPYLESRIAETYAVGTDATLKSSLYDSYIKAFRWASDRIFENKDGGVIGFISNGAWLDSNSGEGFRTSLQKEFSDIYVLNLRGNQRTSGELSRREGGKIFDRGSRTPIAITILVKNPSKTAPATIHYHDIGDYLSREQKLNLVRGFHSISGRSLQWETITPNAKHDWINQRDGVFDTLIPIGDKDKKITNRETWFNPCFTHGLKTQRDPWCYNFSSAQVHTNMLQTISFYNSQCEAYKGQTMAVEDFIDTNPQKISWTRALRNDLAKDKKAIFDADNIIDAVYRPFTKERVYRNRQFNELLGIQIKAFPTSTTKNLVICVSGVGSSKGFSALITDCVPDIQILFNGQCFPLYYYEKKDVIERTLFDDPSADGNFIRRDGITDWILKQVRSRFSGARNLTKEHIFYYVYGLLHSQDYRTRFADDLRKSLPRIPIVEDVNDFMAFYKAGRDLADLHLNYDRCLTVADEEPCPDDCDHYHSVIEPKVKELYGVQVAYSGDQPDRLPQSMEENAADERDFSPETYAYYAIEDKMRFAKVRNEQGKLVEDKSRINFNGHITITNIPAKAYDYVVNGKSAIDWIMERYAVTVDSASGIKNDCNDWASEHRAPRYILDLLLSVINLSCQSVDIINALPKMQFD